MIIGCDLMVQLGLLDVFKFQVLQWDGATAPTKEPSCLLGQTDLTSCNMHQVIMQTTEPVSTREATDRLVKILESTYEKEYLKQVSDKATQMIAEEITELIRLLKYFEDVFDGTLGYWDIDPVDL